MNDVEGKVEGIADVDGDRKVEVDAPAELLFKGVELLREEGGVVVKVEANFADGDEGVGVEAVFELMEVGGVEGVYVGGVKADHGEGEGGEGVVKV